MHTAYHKYILNDPEFSFITSSEEAVEKMLSNERTLMFTNYLPFSGDRRLVSVKHMEDRVMTSLCFAMRKNSEFKEILDYHLLKMAQSSLVVKEFRRHLLEDAPLEELRELKEAKALDMGSVVFPFFIVAFGVVASVIISAFERSWILWTDMNFVLVQRMME